MAMDLNAIAERAVRDSRRAADLQSVIDVLASCETGTKPTFETQFPGVGSGYLAGMHVDVILHARWPEILLETMKAAQEELRAIEERYAAFAAFE
ncbi:hypothetical protein ACLE20_13240 [Rhizobium sp. YIM 134829]|uniref:hypothetical protein n=1 Tax=Rhizobium sp. YIM 134829 TaxID=3390453 RepID=UPI00397AE4AC